MNVLLLIANGERDTSTSLATDGAGRTPLWQWDRRFLAACGRPTPRPLFRRALRDVDECAGRAKRRNWRRRRRQSSTSVDDRHRIASQFQAFADRTVRHAAYRPPRTADVRCRGTPPGCRASAAYVARLEIEDSHRATAAALRDVRMNNTPRPPGSTKGYQWFGLTVCRVRPRQHHRLTAAGRGCHRPVAVSVVENTMRLSSPQLAPATWPGSHTVIAAPPAIDIFLRVRPSKTRSTGYPVRKTAVVRFFPPGSGCASSRSNARRINSAPPAPPR